MPELETRDEEQAYQQMRELQDSEINRVMAELEKHHVKSDVLHSVRSKLEQPATVRIEEEDFTINRAFDQGLVIEWHPHQRAA